MQNLKKIITGIRDTHVMKNPSCPTNPLNSVDSALFVGAGNSSGFFASLLHTVPHKMNVTEHRDEGQINVVPYWNNVDKDRVNTLELTRDSEKLRRFIQKSDPRKSLAVFCTTHPERFEEWLKKLEDAHVTFPENTIFVFPQTPAGKSIHRLSKKYTCLIIDFFPGIGKVVPDKEGNLIAHLGFKDFTEFAVLGRGEPKEAILELAQWISANQEVRFANSYAELGFYCINPLLHLCGIPAYIGEKMGLQMTNTSSQEFLNALKAHQKHPSQIELGEKCFYRDMPAVGPNKLMKDASAEIETVRKILFPSHPQPEDIETRLVEKYRKGYTEIHGNPDNEKDFASKINKNPHYQNNLIQLPRVNGKINTAHRFFVEELPSLLILFKIGQAIGVKMPILKALIECAQYTMQKTYLFPNGTIGPDAPKELQQAKNLADWWQILTPEPLFKAHL